MPARRDSLTSSSRSARVGCGSSLTSARSTPITSRRSSRAWCALALITEAAPATEHVVHLPGDLLPGLGLGVLGAQPRLRLGPLGALPQRGEQRPALPDEQ